jgi:putative acetyltransferase
VLERSKPKRIVTEIIDAHTAEHLAQIRRLFREYEEFLGVDLCFQGFEEEVANLPGAYAPPRGALLLAVEGSDVMGCVALREIDDNLCEMKRLFMRCEYRGRGIGRMLAQAVIDEARRIGYSRMCLDTLETLESAIALYESLGFRRTAPYYDNPLPRVVYWELDLEPPERG